MSKNILIEKWEKVLNHPKLGTIKDDHRRYVTAQILENTEKELAIASRYAPTSLLEAGAPVNAMGASSSTPGDGAIDTFDPVMITLVRRAAPNLIAYDLCGVQPMTGPAGLIFALRSRYTNQTGGEAFYNEANTAFSTQTSGANVAGQKHVGNMPGNTTATANLAEIGLYNFGTGMATANMENLGVANSTGGSDTPFPAMAFSIERVSVTAKGRALKADYSLELAQDLKAIHNLDAESELANILTTEILAEINREIIRTLNFTAKRGCSYGTTTAGVFDLDTDSNGRWSVEKFKGLMFQIEREANQIARETRRGRGNLILCSADVASALQMAGVLDYAPALNSNNGLTPDDTGNTFIGVLNGKYKVYIDPYADATGGYNYVTVGYKGSNAFDAGFFYCPYVPLQMVRAVGEDTFNPRIGFKTRYGMVANPFNDGITAAATGAIVKDTNVYYRRSIVANLL